MQKFGFRELFLFKVRNAHQRVRQEKRVTHDSISNVIFMSFAEPEFFYRGQWSKNFCVIISHPGIIKIARAVLKSNQHSPPPFHLDTTFNVCDDYWGTPITMRMPMFEGNPLLPVMIALHDTQKQELYRDILQTFVDEIPEAKESRMPFITDGDVNFEKARLLLPGTRYLFLGARVFSRS